MRIACLANWGLLKSIVMTSKVLFLCALPFSDLHSFFNVRYSMHVVL